MQFTSIQSSTLVRVGYEASKQLLRVEFRDRSIYRFRGVPADMYQALLDSPSKGQFFNRAIRGMFAHERDLGKISLS